MTEKTKKMHAKLQREYLKVPLNLLYATLLQTEQFTKIK